MKEKFTGFLTDFAWIKDSVRFQCPNRIESFPDKAIHYFGIGIPVVVKEIGNYRFYGNLLCNSLCDLNV